MEQNGENSKIHVADISSTRVLSEVGLENTSCPDSSVAFSASAQSPNRCINYDTENVSLPASENINTETRLSSVENTSSVFMKTTDVPPLSESGAEAAMSYKPAKALSKLTSMASLNITNHSADSSGYKNSVDTASNENSMSDLSLKQDPNWRFGGSDLPQEAQSSHLSDSLSQWTLSEASGAAGTTNDSRTSEFSTQSVYHIKWINWKGNNTPIITQNENGPCPLIAVMNVLILKGKVHLPPMIEMITSGQLMEYLGDCILEQIPSNISEGVQLNFEQNMHDAMANLPKLQTGLDVNVRFSGVRNFEYTSELIVFDLLNIPLYHGWLVDPESPEVASAVGTCSYNQLVEKIIINKGSSKSEIVTEGLIAENFLERTASQLTYHGLCELNLTVPEDELAVLFRNNHFSTVYKHKSELFLLVTDQGFLTESNVVWETLSNVEGDGRFVDANFCLAPLKPRVPPSASLSKEQQIDQDFFVALSLQEEQRQQQEHEAAWQQYKKEELGVEDHLSDEDLARRLQEEENLRSAELASQAQQSQLQGQQSAGSRPHTSVTPGKKNRDCLIL